MRETRPILPDDQLSRLRRFELETVGRFFRASDRVLEIGGGSGFQAALLGERVAEVVSIDIKPHPAPILPVTVYDGRNIPFPEDRFDVIFSSNALEHVEDLDRLLVECRRVLKDGGVAVHILPTVSWRIATTLTHYPALPWIVRRNYRRMRAAMTGTSEAPAVRPDAGDMPRPGKAGFFPFPFKAKWIVSVLRSPRHGERGTALTEVYYYRRRWWRRRFEATGWDVVEDFPTGICYSGNAVFGTILPISWRRFLSRLAGSSTRAFVLKKRLDRSPPRGAKPG